LRSPVPLKLLHLAVAVAAFGSGPSELSAKPTQVYQWTDAAGGVRYSPSAEWVPRDRRHTIVRIELEPGTGGSEAAPDDPEAARVEDENRPTPSPASSAAPVQGTDPPRHRGSWVVQLAARPAQETPARTPELELSEGESLYFVSFQRDGVAWRRLRLGFFSTRAEAQAARLRVAARFPDAWVVAAADADVEAAKGADLPPVAAPPSAGRMERAFAVQLYATRALGEPPPVTRLELQPGERLYRTNTVIEGQTWSRLRVGHFGSWTAARRALDRFGREFPDAWIVPVDAEELRSEVVAGGTVPTR
jgi:hypothetical protein